MTLQFYKYQGTGNDFIILDNREKQYTLTTSQISFLCNRRFGIGADGLMLLNLHPGFDFEMVYYNSDGKEGSMCGNGGRCLVKFAYHSGIQKEAYMFFASDGEHEAEINDDGTVSLKMQDVSKVKKVNGDYLINTGSPHYVRVVNEVKDLNVFEQGKQIRYSDDFKEVGVNVNFVEQTGDDSIYVRTYERGVEDETLSCGTGVTAAALACYHNENGFNEVEVATRGGKLSVEYVRNPDDTYHNVWLTGPAEKVFDGSIELPA